MARLMSTTEDAMFVIGKTYTIEEAAGDGSSGTIEYPNCKLVAVEGSLIKIVQHGKERVINTGSSKFVGAKLDD